MISASTRTVNAAIKTIYFWIKENKYYFFRKYIVFIAAFTVLVFAEIMVRYSGQAALNLIIYYSLPPLLILLNYLNLIRIFKFENLGR